jgi:hypothetical protein
MFNGLRVFHQRSGESPTHTAADDPTSSQGASGEGLHHVPHVWSRHPLEERRSKKRNECFRGLIELEAELEHEVERQD